MTLPRAMPSLRRLPVIVGSAVLLAAACLGVAGVAAARQPLPSPLILTACAAFVFAGVRLHLLIRVGGQKVELCWSEAGLLFALTTAPSPWVVLLTPVVVGASLTLRRFAPIKVVYNVATCTVAVASAAAVLSLAGVTRPFVGVDLLILFGAGTFAGLVTYVAVAIVVAVVQDVPFVTTWRAAAGLQLLTLASQLTVAVGVLVLLHQYGIAMAVVAPLLALSLHQGNEGRLRGRQERDAGRRHAAAVGRLTEDLDEPGVLRRATEDACALADVEVLEIDLPAHGRNPARLYRYSRRADPWSGLPVDAPALPARIVAELPVPTRDGAAAGTLRAWLVGAAPDLHLGQFEQEALASLAQYTGAALRNARVYAEQTHHATHDRLTDLPVRQVLIDRIHDTAVAAVTRSAHELTPVGLILVDLTGYRDLVRSLGHDIAEHLLLRTATQLRAAVMPGEFLAHIGGDDFCVYLEGDSARDSPSVRRRASALLAAVAESYRIDASTTVVLAATAGVAYSPTAVLNGAELLRQAVVALDHARADGMPVMIYDPVVDELGGPAARVMHADLHAAIEDDQFHLDYQPIVDLPSAAPVALEALVRWQHPILGLLVPADFMTVLERSADHGRFLAWYLEEALRTRASCGSGRDLPVGVNIAYRCLLDRSFPDLVADTLNRTGVAPDQLMLELADTDSLTGAGPALPALNALKKLGVRIAIDKFGTGASSLTGLLDLPATDIKIASSFVRAVLHDDLKANAVIGLAVALAQQLKLRVVAIGVPDDEHANRLAALGCGAGQGWPSSLSSPLPASMLSQYLTTAPALATESDAEVIRLDHRRAVRRVDP